MPEPKTIAISANCTWNIWNFRRNLVRSFTQRGYKVIIIAPFDSKSDDLRSMGCELHDIKMEPSSINVMADLYLLLRFVVLLRRIKPNVFLTFTIKPNIYGSIAARITQVRCINNITGIGSAFMQSGIVQRVTKLLLRVSVYHSNVVFFQNREDVNLLLKADVVRKESIDILPGSGVDTKYFLPQRIRPQDDKFTFLCISRLLIDKGILELSAAAHKIKKEHSDVCIQIIGDFLPGHKRSIPDTLIKDLQKNSVIEYLGSVDDIRPFLANSDCVVLPSYREGAPRSLMEASSMEKPVIAADVPGCRDVVDDWVTGLLCQPKSIDSLYVAMQKVLALSQKQREEMGRLGRRKMECEFSDVFVSTKYIEKIEELATLRRK